MQKQNSPSSGFSPSDSPAPTDLLQAGRDAVKGQESLRPQNSRQSRVYGWTLIRKIAKRAAFPFVALIVAPIPFICLVITGVLDLSRNRGLTWGMANRYFFGNGVLTWILSPLNLLLDFLCLPYKNSGIYKVGMLPEACQEEIAYLIEHADREQLADKIIRHLQEERRGMMMFKWYGQNYKTSITMPAYEKRFKYVRTIGVSAFNRRQSTSMHFGPLRATLRVLYNINYFSSRGAYIDVGPVRHYWADEKMFIFDDTLQHQSINDSDAPRVCLFIDVLRPSFMPALLSLAVDCVQLLSFPIRKSFYKNWSFLR